MQESKLRLTPQRLAVLEAVRQASDHPTALEIFRRVQAAHPGIAYGTVYTALNALVKMGLIYELKFGDDASRYDGRMEPHHHALCLRCGALAEVEIALSDGQWAQVTEQTGFDIQHHHIQFSGYCPRCRGKGGAGEP